MILSSSLTPKYCVFPNKEQSLRGFADEQGRVQVLRSWRCGIYASSLKAFSFSNRTVSCVLMLSSGISSSITLLLHLLSGTLGLPWASFLCAVSTRLYLSQSSSGNHGDDLFYFTLRMMMISLTINLSVKATISWVLCICLLKAGLLGKHQLIRYCRKGDLHVQW